jgi:uncharacterized membrane protein
MSAQSPAADRYAAYLSQVRALGRPQRLAGFIVCLVGVMILIVARYRLGAPPWLLALGVGVVALGWILFAYALTRRFLWIRAHPFDPNG